MNNSKRSSKVERMNELLRVHPVKRQSDGNERTIATPVIPTLSTMKLNEIGQAQKNTYCMVPRI